MNAKETEAALKQRGYVKTLKGWVHSSRFRSMGAEVAESYLGRKGEDRRMVQRKESVGGNACLRGPRPARSPGRGEVEVVVTLVQCRRRLLDSHDNLRTSLKPFVDRIAEHLGVEDSDPRIRWEYLQVPLQIHGAPEALFLLMEVR